MCTEAWQGEYEHNNMFSLSLWRISANLKRFVKGNVISWTLLVRQRFHLCRAAFAVDWTLLFFTRCCPCIAQSSPTDLSQIVTVPFSLVFTWADWRDILSLDLSQIITVRLSALADCPASSLFSAFKLNRHCLDTLYLRCWWGMFVCARENKGNYLISPQCNKTAHLFIFICGRMPSHFYLPPIFLSLKPKPLPHV